MFCFANPDAAILEIGLLTISVVLPCLGAVFTLAPNGDDTGSGGRASPWRSIRRANGALRPGDTLVFLPGVYEGTIAPEHGGTPDAPIHCRSDVRHRAVLAGGGDSQPAVDLQEKHNIRIEGFRIAPGEGRWLRADGCDRLAVAGCYMEKAGNATPFVLTGCTHVRLIDNVFRKDRVGGNMCQVVECTYVLIEGNAFSRVGHCPLQISMTNNLVVRSNCFHNPWGRNYEFWASGRVLVEGNIVTEALDSAHSADSRAKNLLIDGIVRFNRVYGNLHTPLNSSSYVPVNYHVRDPFRFVNSRVYHNTIADNLGYGWEITGVNVSSNVFVNNIFCRNDKYGGNVQIARGDGIAGDNLFLSNVFRGTEAGQRVVRYGDRFRTADEANRASVVRGHWREFEENLDVDPCFVDSENRDFRLRPGSPCIHAGRALTVTRRAGRGREVPVDDGRYFYDGFGIEGEMGDRVAVGRADRIARIEKVLLNYYQPDLLVLDREMQWDAGAPVSLPWCGEAPDIGAYERGLPGSGRGIARAEPVDTEPGREVRFYAEPAGRAVASVRWDFGDGETAQGCEAVHVYSDCGHHPARVRVRYEDGDDEADVVFVRVNQPVDPCAPMLVVDFEEETTLEWGYLFKIYRGNRLTGHEFVADGFGGGRCVRLFAEADGSDLGCSLAPGDWDIDTYPFIRFAYRIPRGVPVGLWLQAFPSEAYGEGVVIAGGTSSRESGPYPDTGACTLMDDGRWHAAILDARTIREQIGGVRYLRRFRFYTHGNAKEGHQFWFDEFEISSAGRLDPTESHGKPQI